MRPIRSLNPIRDDARAILLAAGVALAACAGEPGPAMVASDATVEMPAATETAFAGEAAAIPAAEPPQPAAQVSARLADAQGLLEAGDVEGSFRALEDARGSLQGPLGASPAVRARIAIGEAFDALEKRGPEAAVAAIDRAEPALAALPSPKDADGARAGLIAAREHLAAARFQEGADALIGASEAVRFEASEASLVETYAHVYDAMDLLASQDAHGAGRALDAAVASAAPLPGAHAPAAGPLGDAGAEETAIH